MKKIPKLQTAFQPLIYNRELNMATSQPIDRTYNVRFPYNINVTKKRTHFASKSPRTSRRAQNVQPYYINAGDLVTAAIGPLNVASPGQHIGAIRDANLQRKDENTTWAGNYFRSLMRGNSGWVTPEYAEEHPLASLAWNVGGDALTLGGPKAIQYLTKMDMPRYGFKPTTKYYFEPGYAGMNWFKFKKNTPVEQLTQEIAEQPKTNPLSLITDTERFGSEYKQITLDDLQKLAQERIGRKLTTTELKDYIGHRRIDLGNGEPELGFSPRSANGNKEPTFVLEETDIPEALSNFDRFTSKGTIRTRMGNDKYSLQEVQSMLDNQGNLKPNVALQRVYPGEHGKANWFFREAQRVYCLLY